MKTFKTIFIIFILSLTLSDAHAHQNQFDPLMTHLHHDSFHGEYEKVKILLQTECFRKEINEKNSKGQTPLHFAAMKGHLEIIKLLIEHGADVNAQANNGQTALLIAVTQSHKNIAQITEYLLKNGADVTLTCFMPATKKYLYKMKNVTPLHTALLSNQPFEITELLVEHAKQNLSKEEFKTFINAQTNNGQTALHIATNQGQKETIKYLLDNDTDITLPYIMPVTKDNPHELKNVTLLHSALLNNQSLEIIQLLVEQAKEKLTKEEFNAFINAQTNHSSTVLHITVAQGQKETIKYLLDNGANPNIQNNDNVNKKNKIRSPFQLLIRLHEQSPIKYENQDSQRYSSKELCELIPLFLEHGTRIDLANKYNQTPLYWIIRMQLTNKLKMLIENSTQKNNIYEALKVENNHKVDKFSKTIWDTLKIFYNPKIIDILVNTKNKDNKTLIDIALERNDQEVLVKLQSYQHALEITEDFKQVKYYDLLPQVKTVSEYPSKKFFFATLKGIVYCLEENIINDKERYLCYEHNNLKLRYDFLFRSLQYRRKNTENFKTTRPGKGCLLDKQVTIFDLRHPDKRKFYYWYQNNKLKFRQSGNNNIFELHIKS